MIVNKIRNVIERIYIIMAALIYFIGEEVRAGLRGFGIKRLILISKGFHYNRIIPYDFNKWKFSDYISDFEQKKIQFVNHPYNKLLNNKIIFSTYFSGFFRTPCSYCLINNGYFSPISTKTLVTNFKDLAVLAAKNKKLMLKPVEGEDAQGIYLVTFNDGKFQVNYNTYSCNDFEKFIMSLDQYLIEEFIEQGEITRALYPKSSNTLRVITLIDPSTSNPFIPIATIRIGTSNSAPVDFFKLGGLIAYINIENGDLSKSMAMAENNSLVFYDNHPETNGQIKGLNIPRWNEMVDKLLSTAKIIAPLIKVVGWDIIITDDGFVVIEGNSGPDTKIQGLNYPLAKNTKVLNFLKYHKIR
jgi:hypothetical protein